MGLCQQERQMREPREELEKEQQFAASLQQEIRSAKSEQQKVSMELSTFQSKMDSLQSSLDSSQQRCKDLEEAQASLESNSARAVARLASMQTQLSAAASKDAVTSYRHKKPLSRSSGGTGSGPVTAQGHKD